MARVSVQVPIEDPAAQPDTPAPMTTEPALPQKRRISQKSLLIGFIIAAVLVMAILVMALLNDRKQLKEEVTKLSTPQTNTTVNDAQKYQEEISKIVELPTGQTPSLIPVNDAQKLASENPFFKNAQNGDVVLLYVSPDKSVRAILYRPSTHKVVEATSSATIGSSGTTAPVKQ